MSKSNCCLLLIEQSSGLVGGVWFLDDLTLEAALVAEQFKCLLQGFLAFRFGAKLRCLCIFETVIGSGESHAVRGWS